MADCQVQQSNLKDTQALVHARQLGQINEKQTDELWTVGSNNHILLVDMSSEKGACHERCAVFNDLMGKLHQSKDWFSAVPKAIHIASWLIIAVTDSYRSLYSLYLS